MCLTWRRVPPRACGCLVASQEVRENLTVVSELRVQQVTTTLSLVATIFLPLTFLTGVFGMNFTYDDK